VNNLSSKILYVAGVLEVNNPFLNTIEPFAPPVVNLAVVMVVVNPALLSLDLYPAALTIPVNVALRSFPKVNAKAEEDAVLVLILNLFAFIVIPGVAF
jgi:hypothetical protein